MKITNSLCGLFAVLLFTVACQNNTSHKKQSVTTNPITVYVHNAQNAIDWEGTYLGVIPCASCPGINTLITLNRDGTYENTIEYLESDDTPTTTKGKFIWNRDGNKITIGERYYLVEENQLRSLDIHQKVMEGNLAKNYILTKVQAQSASVEGAGSTSQSFVSSDNKDYNIIFNTNANISTALVKTEGFTQLLYQTQAWAKGATYLGSNTQLTVKGDKATLTVNNQSTDLRTSSK